MKISNTLTLAKFLGLYINLLRYIAPKKATIVAYRYFSQPRKGKIQSDNIPLILAQAKVTWLALETQRFPLYTWKGSGKTVLLIHGWESNASRWHTFITLLQKEKFNILAIDAPAHGQASGKTFNIPSYAACIHKTISIHNPEFIIGHSIGATACLLQQHLFYTPKIVKMVLLGPASELKVLLKNYANILGLHPKISQSLDDYICQHFAIDTDNFAGHIFSENLKIKGLVIHDLEDKVVHISQGEKIAKHWPNAKFKTTKGLGHSMHQEKLYKDIIRYL